MVLRTDPAQVARFSVFELDLRSGELRKSGVRIALQDQPLEILKALLERPGELITREELRQRLWREDTFVDFEDGLNAAIRRLRDALGDNATSPLFVETLPRRGYRFIAALSDSRPGFASVLPAQQRTRRLPAALGGALQRRVLWWISAAVVAVTVAVTVTQYGHTTPPALPVVRFPLRTEPLAVFGPGPAVALSPDGTFLAYVAGDSPLGQLYLRRQDSLDSKAVPDAEQVQGPFFSPDGRWLAFFTRGTLQKVSVAGGSPFTVCTLPTMYAELIHGGSWGDDGSIVFESGTRLWRVPADGGAPKRIAMPDDASAFFPELLPGSQVILFRGARLAPSLRSGVWALSLGTGELELLVEGGGTARYVRSGHLVYEANGSLIAAPFDLASVQLTGPPAAVINDVSMDLSLQSPRVRITSATAHFTVSHTGTLAYLSGPTVPAALRKLVWIDRSGKEHELPATPRAFSWPRLSPDGSRLAVGMFDGHDAPGNVGIYDLTRGSWTQLTAHPAEDGRPLWTPDGMRVVFRSYREGTSHLFWQSADGAGVAQRLSDGPNPDRTPWSFAPDGRELVFSERSEQTYDLQVLQLDGRHTRTLPRTRFFKGSPAISPNGRWIAYRATESERDEIYVRPFADWDRQKWTISTNGGRAPVWSADGRELFYLNGATMMAVPVKTTGDFAYGTPKRLFDGPYVQGSGGARNFDIAPDGRRFLMIKEVEGKRETPARDRLIVVLNWLEELRRLAPHP